MTSISELIRTWNNYTVIEAHMFMSNVNRDGSVYHTCILLWLDDMNGNTSCEAIKLCSDL